MEIDWEGSANTMADVGDVWNERYGLANLVRAVQQVCVDELGKEAIKSGLQKVGIKPAAPTRCRSPSKRRAEIAAARPQPTRARAACASRLARPNSSAAYFEGKCATLSVTWGCLGAQTRNSSSKNSSPTS